MVRSIWVVVAMSLMAVLGTAKPVHALDQSCPALNLMKADKGQHITLRFVGDIVLPTQAYSQFPDSMDDYLFAGVSDYLRNTDASFGNLEGVLTTQTTPRRPSEDGRFYNFAFDPRYTRILKNAGFTILNIANNHSLDYGPIGFEDTIKHLANADLIPVGIKNDIKIITVRGLRIGFVGFAFYPHQNAIQNMQATARLVEEAKKQSDYLIVSFHGGEEGPQALWQDDKIEYFLEENRGNSVAFARNAIEAGADAVIGHGPHVIRSIECYKGKPVVYSLGNFMTVGGLSNQGTTGQSMIIGLQVGEDGRTKGVEILPVTQTQNKLPWYDHHHQSLDLINRLAKSARYKGDFLTIEPVASAILSDDLLFKDALEAKRSFSFNEVMRLATRYNLRIVPPLSVLGKEQDLELAMPHIDHLLSLGKLQQMTVLKNKRPFSPHSYSVSDALYNPDLEITASISKTKGVPQDFVAKYSKLSIATKVPVNVIHE